MQRITITIGEKFGKLTVTGEHSGRTDKRFYDCTCECGKTTIATASALKTGHKVSCGCAQRESIQKTMVKHGYCRAGSVTPEYNTYMAMIQRCHNPNNCNYPNYGGRKDVSIYVMDEWRGENGFANFMKDMGPRPSDGHSIGRLDNNGPYGPGLCEWQDRHTQSRNTSKTVFYEFNGERLCVKDWADKLGISATSMRKRFNKWGVHKALSTPVPSRADSGEGVEPTPESSNQSQA